MEISRPITPGYGIKTEATSQAKTDGTQPAKAPAAGPSKAGEPYLEQLQSAMDRLPEVDVNRVEQIKLALARGEIAVDNAALAKDMLAYHTGSDA